MFGWLQQLFRVVRPQKWTTQANANATSANQPKYEEAEQYRQDASNHAAAKGKYMADSQAAFRMGDKKAAKDLSDLGKEEGHEMDRLNRIAADIFFKHNNPNDNGSNRFGLVDLHGLFVKEAMMYAERAIQKELDRVIDDDTPDTPNTRVENIRKASKDVPLIRGRVRQVVFIVGMGNHSEGHVRKIKPALDEMIAEKYPTFRLFDDKPHKGCILVDFNENDNENEQRLTEAAVPSDQNNKQKGNTGCVIA
jgi:Domain of unknown function (DUF1771)/Smr domain